MAKEEMDLIRGFVANIQSLKDAHINDGLPINYGMLCTITTNGWKLIEELKALEQESQTFEWCTGCREYDQEKHCCHRWSKVIRDTVEEMKEAKTGHWIAVSERLPKIRQDVLCQCRGNNYSVLRLNHDSDWECIYPRTTYMQSFVIAWMPLPEPFEPQKSEVQDERG